MLNKVKDDKKLVNTYKNNDTSIQLFERVLEPPSDLTPEEKRARAKKRKLEYPDWKVAKLFQKDETKKPSKDQLINDEELSDYVEDFIEDLFNDRGLRLARFSDHTNHGPIALSSRDREFPVY